MGTRVRTATTWLTKFLAAVTAWLAVFVGTQASLSSGRDEASNAAPQNDIRSDTAAEWLALLLTAHADEPGPGDWSPTPTDSSPQLTIDGPATAPAGTLVTLTATTTATRTAWILADGPDNTWRPDSDGHSVNFAAPEPGRYVFICAAANDAGLSLLRHQITLTGGTPAPAPGPGPNPPPDPPAPDAGRYNLAATALELCGKLPTADRPLIAQIATNYNNAARRIAAGDPAWQSPEAIRRQTAEANRTTLGDQRPRLLPLLFEPLARQLATLETTPGLNTPGDLATAWREIAAGLDRWSRTP